MQPTAIYATREGNLTGETVEMTVDAGSMAHVMSLLTDLYSNPIAAVIREYSSNALDSHVAAGETRPIEVSIPNALSPFFKVKDYGVGLSADDIREIYSKYGASTKRGTNEQVGMLGLGCKSALTYTQQFTIRAVKDNQLVFVAISRTETGTGVMKIVHTETVDEENSVEISVPSTDADSFRNEADNFFRFWKSGTVLVDGNEPDPVKGVPLSEEITLIKSSMSDYVVMGNVAYRVSNEHALYSRTGYLSQRFGIVVRVPIGSVNFTPSREDLMYTSLTKTTLEDIRRQVIDSLESTIKREIDSKDTHEAARKESEEWLRLTGHRMHTYSYKGESIPTEVGVRCSYYRPDYGRNSVAQYHSLNFHNLETGILIHGYEHADISTSHRAKMRLFAEQNSLRGSFIVTKDKIEQKWFTNARSYSWEEVFATKKPREERSVSKETYHVTDGDYRYGKMTDFLPANKKIILWTNSLDGAQDHMPRIVRLIPDSIAVRLPRNRWEKFIRENKNAVTLAAALDKMYADAVAGLSSDDKIAMMIPHADRLALRRLDPKRLDDPELKHYAEVVHKIVRTNAMDKYQDVRSVLIRLNHSYTGLDKVVSFSEKYPLMAAVTDEPITAEHFYLYANTLYSNEVNNV